MMSTSCSTSTPGCASVVRKVICTKRSYTPLFPYSQAMICGPMMTVSGLTGTCPKTGQLVSGSMEAQCEMMMTNLYGILESAHCTYKNVLKTNVLLTDINDFPTLNKVYEKYFKCPYPARTTVQVAALPRGAKCEIECICCVSPMVDMTCE